MNLATLTKIEYKRAKDASIDFFPKNGVNSTNFEGNWTEIDFIPFSGGFVSSPLQGINFQTKLQFKIAEINTTNQSLINDLVRNHNVYRVTDPQGIIHIVGSNHFKARATAKELNEVSVGSHRGFQVEVVVKSTHLPLLYSDI